ncbi:hypothetical protein C2E23DRAFT_455263 [Lenzites betulinus]|nr:hypothetical protein C2E23DRAFT_455263 [Lenzites betulinus]
MRSLRTSALFSDIAIPGPRLSIFPLFFYGVYTFVTQMLELCAQISRFFSPLQIRLTPLKDDYITCTTDVTFQRVRRRK